MLTFVTVVLTVLLVVDCLLLGLLILIQLPKKEAGVGVAFGGGATDALFGAGSGNALTKLTKYTATAFFGLVIVLSILQVNQRNASSSETKRLIETMPAVPAPSLPSAAPETAPATPTPSSGTPATPPPAGSNVPALLFDTASNAAPAATTNPPAAPAK
jgi:preprotein translocase subunit SecG